MEIYANEGGGEAEFKERHFSEEGYNLLRACIVNRMIDLLNENGGLKYSICSHLRLTDAPTRDVVMAFMESSIGSVSSIVHIALILRASELEVNPKLDSADMALEVGCDFCLHYALYEADSKSIERTLTSILKVRLMQDSMSAEKLIDSITDRMKQQGAMFILSLN